MSTTQRVTRSASRQSLGASTTPARGKHDVQIPQSKNSASTKKTAARTKKVAESSSTSVAASASAPAKNGRKSSGATKKDKAGVAAEEEAELKAGDPEFATPPRKRQKKNGNAEARLSPPKEGPQHHGGSRLDLIAGQHVLEDAPHPPNPPPARPAEPHITNATLETPRGSKLVAYRRAESLSPIKSAAPKPKAKAKAAAASKGTTVAKGKGRKSGAGKDESAGATTATEVAVNDDQSSKEKVSLPAPTTDTNRLLSDAIAHLVKVAPKLQPVIDRHHCHIFSPEGLAEPVDPFRSLTSSIIGQQVSGAAAAAIKRRFVALFVPDAKEAELDGDADPYLDSRSDFPTPEMVAGAEIPLLRTAGLSQRKAEYVKGLAEKFASGELGARMLIEAGYDEVLERLIAVRGLGRWSVEMFACFALKRMDVFSTGDLGVQRGMAAFAGKDVAKLKNKGGKWKYMSEQDMLDMAEPFAPYRSLFMWYMWHVADVSVEAIESA